MKRIIICCDGTSNKPDAKFVTNVVKVARGVADKSVKGQTHQVVFYDQGVGSHGFFDTITGGAFGAGPGSIVPLLVRDPQVSVPPSL